MTGDRPVREDQVGFRRHLEAYLIVVVMALNFVDRCWVVKLTLGVGKRNILILAGV
jgi:hypothetical protein